MLKLSDYIEQEERHSLTDDGYIRMYTDENNGFYVDIYFNPEKAILSDGTKIEIDVNLHNTFLADYLRCSDLDEKELYQLLNI